MHESTEERLGKLTAEQRAALVAELRSRRAAERETGRIPVVGRDEPLPLSFAQQRLWFMHQWADGKPIYNTPMAMRLRGELDVTLLRDAVSALVARHESLRTRYVNTPGGPRQIIGAPAADLLTVSDLRQFEDRERRAADLLTTAGRRRFDLERDSLLRADLVRLAADEHLLVLALHHIATDAWSTEILTRELIELYGAAREGRPAVLPELSIQYADYAAWQHGAQAAAARESSMEYWREALAGLETLRFPADRPRPAAPSWAGDTVHDVLPARLHRELQALGGPEPTRVLPLALAALAAVSGRYTGQDDIVAGTAFSGRTRPELEQLIGYFANTVVLRVSTAGDPNFRELLARAKDTVYSAHPHQDVPFDQLVNELRPERDAGANPVFQVALLQVDEQLKAARMGDVEVEGVALHTGTARFDMTLSVAERSAGGVELGLEYATELFDRDRMQRFLQHTRQLLESAVARPDARLSELDLLPLAERVRLTVHWNDTKAPVAPGTVDEAFDAQAERTPDATAVVSRDGSLTYEQLRRRANQVAHRLISVGVRPGSLVGVAVGRSVDTVAALLGVLKAGAAYVPLDPKYPAARLGFVLEDAAPAAVLVDAESKAAMAQHGVTLIDVADVDGEPATAPEVAVTPEMLSYVCYTSGSTGQPKGVMVDHRKVITLYTELDRRIGTDEPGVWLAVSSISFDISVVELLWTLARGFTVVVAEANTDTMLGTARPARKLDFGLFYFASDDSSAPGSERYRLLLEGAKYADRNGFSSVWTPERHFHAFGGLYPAPSVAAAALAVVTDRISIRAGSVVLPLHNPVRVAEEWSVVDNLSDGRVGMSVASGWHRNDFVFAPDNYAERKKIMLESVETVRSLWRGESVHLPAGEGADVEVRLRPAPVQAELPMWLSAAGSPETFRAAGHAGLGLLTHMLGQDLDALAEKIAVYRAAWRERHGTDGGHVALMLHTFIDPDGDRARSVARDPFIQYLSTSLDLLRGLAKQMGLEFETLGEDDRLALLEHAADRYMDSGGLFGTPEQCVRFAEKLAELGVDEIACLIDFGVPTDDVLASLPHVDTVRRAFTGAKRDAGLAAQIRAHGVSHMQCTPTLAGLLAGDADAAEALGSLKVLFVGGEALTGDLARRLGEITSAELHNMYGPTETTVWSTADRVAGEVTIGTPLANEAAYVLDRRMQPQPVGVAGELFIGGDGVTAGYHRRPGLTADRFVPDPFAGGGRRLYRTGDLARWRGDGRLEFLGRADDQVKIRGHRLELGEIEAALLGHPMVRSAAVAAWGEADRQYLAAYLVPEDGTRPGDADLRRHLRDVLPEHMVPARYTWLDAFPLTPNGKVDRKRLPEPGAAAPEVRYEPPATPVEEILAEIWQEVLGAGPVGVLTGFFDLGGNSISVVLVVDKANRRGVPVTARQLFQHQTIRELAGVVTAGDALAGAGSVVTLNGSGTSAPLICLHASTGSSLPYVPLSKHLGDRPCYAIELPEDARRDVPELARRYAAVIRQRWPEGPYHLVGWSLGGSLAVAVAAELGDVRLLALLDTVSPEVPGVPVPLPLAVDGFVRSVAGASGLDVTLDVAELSALEPGAQYEKALNSLAEAGLLPDGQHDEMLARAKTFVDLTTAVSVWQPERHRGVVDLLVPDDSSTTAAGWESFVDGEVRVTAVRGDHFSMMQPANASELAAVLRSLAVLRETEMEVGNA
ncbi:MupA/Atu3671 family FMN-dependent luciferase-like monooxygenase [Lentzea sp. NPDC092896]|uniref:MupA/Atu3671 family FMN-dependent luciferase-like monooxygenase n=1 Tax=Lentzea sp. NPDC092896 TaxID=3364127 RepID=UPI00381C670A